MTTPTLSLHRKLAQVMYEAERIPKNGTAPAVMGGYKFVQVGDAADFIRKALAEKVISMVPSAVEVLDKTEHETARGGSMTTVDLRVTWTLTDGESGETATIVSYGAGADGGDKYSGKATTSAMKYALLAGFLLSTGEDTEQTDTSDRQRRSESTYTEPEEHLLGDASRTGKIVKGSGMCDLQWREGPDGHAIGFTLRIADDKNIPQVLLKGPVGEGVHVLTNGDVAQLRNKTAHVSGRLFELRKVGEAPSYRLYVTHIKTDEFEVPAEAESLPLFTVEEQAEIAARELAEAQP